jgi:hypothetical protein
MPITNILDRRKRKYRFKKINAVVEATWHDHLVEDADQVDGQDGPAYDQLEHVSLAEAVVWAGTFSDPVTLYIYDEDSGIY